MADGQITLDGLPSDEAHESQSDYTPSTDALLADSVGTVSLDDSHLLSDVSQSQNTATNSQGM